MIDRACPIWPFRGVDKVKNCFEVSSYSKEIFISLFYIDETSVNFGRGCNGLFWGLGRVGNCGGVYSGWHEFSF